MNTNVTRGVIMIGDEIMKRVFSAFGDEVDR